MDSFFIMLKLQLILLVFLLMGIYIKRRNIVTKEAQPYFASFLVRIALPCMIFNSFGSDAGLEMLVSASKALIISFVMCLISFALGTVLYCRSSSERRAVMRYGTLVSNAGFAGLPQVQGSFGTIGLLYASLYLIPIRVFMWSVGIALFMKSYRKGRMKKVLLNPGMIAVYAGLPRMLLRIQLPDFLDSAIKSIGDCTNSLSMITIGMIVADIPLQKVVDKDVVYLTLVRLLILPIVALTVLTAINADSVLKGVCVILTAMPVGVNTPILAQKYKGEHEFASKCVLLSTVMSLVTLPLISVFL